MRQTPLKLAIEMADASVVERLIALGARMEDQCGGLPSPLCYAMSVFQTSLHRNDLTQEQGYRHAVVHYLNALSKSAHTANK